MSVAIWRSPEGPTMTNARFRRLVRELGAGPGVDGLCAAVGEKAGRPVRVLRSDLPPELPSGLVVVTEQAFVIFLDELADPLLQDGIVCHELAHLLLGHHLEPLGEEATRRILPSLDPAAVVRTLGRTCYDAASEREAEALGTLLFSRLNPWPVEQSWQVPATDSAVIGRIERMLGA